MRTFTAFTSEIDDAELAVSEIVEQLDLDGLEKNSIGIVSCYSEFIASGVVKALSDRLPFEVVGITTMENAVPGIIDEMTLTLMVITDNEASFSIGLSGPLSGDDAPVREAYDKASAGYEGKPSLIISFASILMDLSGDFYVEAMDRISGGVPNFGSLSIDHTNDYHESRVICGGEAYRDRYAFVLVYGDIQPQFFIGTISDERVFQESGVITASKANLLETVNGMSATDYLLTLGLTKDESGTIAGINTYPFIVDFSDGSEPVVRAVYAMNADGCAVCGGDVPTGAKLSVGMIDSEDIISTSSAILEKAIACGKDRGMLLFSCVGRYFAQGYDPAGEAVMLSKRLDGVMPYFFACSGGELCPVRNADGSLKNRNHNDSIVICVF